MDIIQVLAEEFGLLQSRVEQTVQLIDEGNTIPFIARYRKEVTGGMDDVTLRGIDERLLYLRNLDERKEEVIRLIDEQGKLTEDLQKQINEAKVLQRVEDLYKPYKKKKATRASKAKEKGLEPLADLIWAQKLPTGAGESNLNAIAKTYTDADTGKDHGVASVEEAIQGACDIIAERISDDPEITSVVRTKTQETGVIYTEAVDPEEKTVYDMYYDHSEGISKMPNHRILAMNRGEKEKKLKVKVQTDSEKIESLISDMIGADGNGIAENTEVSQILQDTVSDSYKRLIAPSIEREMRNMLTERAEAEAVKVFAKNTESLLMVPPVKGARIISIDPGYRTGCKVAVLDETGKLKAYTTVFPTEPKKDIKGTEATLKKLVDKFAINTIVIGNGTASRETEEVVADFIKKYDSFMAKRDPSFEKGKLRYTIVNEAGASVYSASKLATEEYPDLDVTVRGAMSLGRRLQDPLAELVKIPTKSIGVGQYQHDINQTLLEGALDNVVEDVVNRVGVELNTASPSLLAHVAGINMGIAKNIVAYREENGVFTKRTELKKVPRLGDKAYGQCAGFIRIADGKNPLDNTAVHPESYKLAEAMLEKLGYDMKSLSASGFSDIEDRIWEMYGSRDSKPSGRSDGALKGGRVKGFAALNELAKAQEKKDKKEDQPKRNLKKAIEKMAAELDAGLPTLTDIVAEMKKPGRDPREDAPEVIFRNDVRAFEDLKIDMELEGTVRNVVDFGAFVDIGVKQDGLVHISEMSRKFINHPMDVVSVGDTVKVKIINIDYDKKKIGLTMKL